ncbi:hypothetical protein OAT16_04305 [Prolixibacteraceae bacterium]|nr:hypothetical protein [Prolixibacteraceae bacterium]
MRKLVLFIMVFISIACSKEELTPNTETFLLEQEMLKFIDDHHVEAVGIRALSYRDTFYTKDFEVKNGMLRVGRVWYALSSIEECRLVVKDSSLFMRIFLK